MASSWRPKAKNDDGAGVVSAIAGTLMAIVSVWILVEVSLIGLVQARIDRVSQDLARLASSTSFLSTGATIVSSSNSGRLLGSLSRSATVTESYGSNDVSVRITVPIHSITGSATSWLFGNEAISGAGVWPLEVS